MALIGRVIEHVLVIATGSGRNGKGILAGAISNALGDYSVTASNDLLIAGRYGHKSAGELAAQMVLRGARWAVMSELNKGDRMDESTMKNLTGGDNITAKFMGQNMVEFAPSHTFFMQTNDLPTVDADAKAAWARIRVVPFDVSFIGREDPTLKERLEAEADAVLTWAVEGLREYQNIGLAAPESVLKTTEQYHQENDSLARFISEQCIVHPAASVAKGRLAAAYTEWAKENGEDAMTAKAIGSRLKQTKGIRETNSGSRGWSGIGMAATEENGSDMGKQHKQQIYPEILTGNEYRKPPGTSVVSVAHDFAPALCLVCGDALDDNEHEHHLECAA
jgi:putative DNA primase/helicase